MPGPYIVLEPFVTVIHRYHPDDVIQDDEGLDKPLLTPENWIDLGMIEEQP